MSIEKIGDLAKMSPEDIAKRTKKLAVYRAMQSLHGALHEAKKSGVPLGNAAELDLKPYFDAVKVEQKLTYSGKVGPSLK